VGGWNNNNKMDLQEVQYETMDRIHLAEDCNKQVVGCCDLCDEHCDAIKCREYLL
jgi:hypothetical protein